MLRPQHVTDGDRDGIRYARRDVAIDIMLMSEFFLERTSMTSETSIWTSSPATFLGYHHTPTATARSAAAGVIAGGLASSPKVSVSLKELFIGAVLIFPPNCPNLVSPYLTSFAYFS